MWFCVVDEIARDFAAVADVDGAQVGPGEHCRPFLVVFVVRRRVGVGVFDCEVRVKLICDENVRVRVPGGTRQPEQCDRHRLPNFRLSTYRYSSWPEFRCGFGFLCRLLVAVGEFEPPTEQCRTPDVGEDVRLVAVHEFLELRLDAILVEIRGELVRGEEFS